MATITGLTAVRMIAIEDATIVSAEVVDGDLILTRFDGSTVNAGPVTGATGPTGPAGPMGGMIPGEVKLWPGTTLPDIDDFGKWVWANGAVYSVATYPLAAANIATAWKTFAGASDPGSGNFRVPDLRGLVPAGLDQMPGDSSRANRMTRSVAITIAAKTGEETHVITIPEMPAHNHVITDPGHSHTVAGTITTATGSAPNMAVDNYPSNTGRSTAPASTGISIQNRGGDTAHENVQPTVFVPYIVKLDD